MNTKVDIFTDGSALKNQSNAPAGWAFYIPSIDYLHAEGMYGTNNQAELTAIYKAICYVMNMKQKEVLIYSDSQYSIDVITGAKKASKNKELIKDIQLLISNLKEAEMNIKFKHIDAHTGKKDYISISNDKVDKAARDKATEMKNK